MMRIMKQQPDFDINNVVEQIVYFCQEMQAKDIKLFYYCKIFGVSYYNQIAYEIKLDDCNIDKIYRDIFENLQIFHLNYTIAFFQEFMNIDKTCYIVINLNKNKLNKNFVEMLNKIIQNNMYKIIGKIITINFNLEDQQKTEIEETFQQQQKLIFVSKNYLDLFQKLFQNESMLKEYQGMNENPIFELQEIFEKISEKRLNN